MSDVIALWVATFTNTGLYGAVLLPLVIVGQIWFFYRSIKYKTIQPFFIITGFVVGMVTFIMVREIMTTVELLQKINMDYWWSFVWFGLAIAIPNGLSELAITERKEIEKS